MFSDLSLSGRLERGEALAAADYIESRQRLGADSEWMQIAGVFALYDGSESPATQTFGIGLFEPALPESLRQIEAFFFDRGAPALHEASPLAGVQTLSILHERGYRPVELTSLLFIELPRQRRGIARIQVRVVEAADLEQWMQTAAQGWGISDPDFFRSAVLHRRSTFFLAEVDDRPAASGSVSINENVALLSGASTVPEFRGRGAQRALLHARLDHAAANGCDLAMMGAEPGGASQRNAEREGFRIAYTRTKWRLDYRGSR